MVFRFGFKLNQLFIISEISIVEIYLLCDLSNRAKTLEVLCFNFNDQLVM